MIIINAFSHLNGIKIPKKTYEKNFGIFPHGDINKININNIPNFDILTAGFPCQPFSDAGLKQGFDDHKGRGTIFFNILDYIDKQRPNIFILIASRSPPGLVDLCRSRAKFVKQ